MTGTVYLVGAGPGDPGLITARGLTLLRSADAVVHDRLVSPDLLAQHRPDADIHDVGKVPGQHGRGRQREICDLLVTLAREGKMVVRLKGGDPFVFGRGGEEAEACASAGVPFEVVPGVTSPVAVPAYAGIPLTHRALASSFAVVTGHEDPARGVSRVDWTAMARIDTLVILMGVESLPVIVEHLRAAGRSPETPVAVVSHGTYARQRTVTGTLCDIRERVEREDLTAPVTIVVGEVVRLRARIRWFDQRPLSGRRVLVPRTREKRSIVAQRLRDLGADVLEVPSLAVEHHPERVEAVLDTPSRYDTLLVTSPAAVEALQAGLSARNLDARALSGLRLAAAGPGTDAAFRRMGIRPDLTIPSYLAGPIADALSTGKDRAREILLLRQGELPDTVARTLRERGLRVHDLAAYSVRADERPATLGPVDAVVFSSSGSVHALNAISAERWPGTAVFCMGDRTAAAARDTGWPVSAVAPEPTFDALVETVLADLQSEDAHAAMD